MRRSLDVHHARVFADGTFDIARVRSVDIGELHAKIAQHLVEQAWDSAIKIVAADDVVARLVHRGNRIDGSHPAGKNSGSHAALQCRKILFNTITRGVRYPRILVSLVLAN